MSERVGDVIPRRIGIPGEFTHPLDRSPQSRILRQSALPKKVWRFSGARRFGLPLLWRLLHMEQRKLTSIGGEASA
jgi:hypothetical protein